MFLASSKILLISFCLNLFWEFAHCRLYKTCRELSLNKRIVKLVIAAIKDSLWVWLFWSASLYISKGSSISSHLNQIIVFIILSLLFSCIDEKASLKLKRWEYAESMPTVFGVGVTPLLELAATGLLAFYLI